MVLKRTCLGQTNIIGPDKHAWARQRVLHLTKYVVSCRAITRLDCHLQTMNTHFNIYNIFKQRLSIMFTDFADSACVTTAIETTKFDQCLKDVAANETMKTMSCE